MGKGVNAYDRTFFFDGIFYASYGGFGIVIIEINQINHSLPYVHSVSSSTTSIANTVPSSSKVTGNTHERLILLPAR